MRSTETLKVTIINVTVTLTANINYCLITEDYSSNLDDLMMIYIFDFESAFAKIRNKIFVVV